MILATACSSNQEHAARPNAEKEGLEVWNLGFDESHKKFWMDIKIKDEFAPSPAIIEKMDVAVRELDITMDEVDEKAQPKVTGKHSLISDLIGERNQHALILSDLTLGEKDIRTQMILVSNLREVFPENNLRIAFIKGSELTESFPVTDYLIENFFQPVTEEYGDKMLYRAMLSKLDEMNGRKSRFYPSIRQDSVWRNLNDRQKVMIVLSDGSTYSGERPMDPMHFDLQRMLLNDKDTICKFPVYYVDYAAKDTESEDNQNNAEALLGIFTRHTGGKYISSSAWINLSRSILSLEGDSCADTRIYLENPDNKVFRGQQRWLKVEMLNSDTVFAVGYRHYAVGSVYNPITVNGISDWRVIVQGVVMVVCLLLIIYLVFQFIVPWIRYRLFLRKYVTKYTGRNMGFNGIQVDEVCYFCKAPFQEDDDIVVRCEHVMHKSCWDENEYKCPEYGRKCQTGSHYYNTHKLYDSLNAPYYIKWLLAGACAGALAWLFFLLNLFGTGYEYLIDMVSRIPNISADNSISAGMVRIKLADLSHTPYFGLYICSFLTLLLSILSSSGNWWWKRIMAVIAKALIAGCCGFIAFVLANIVKHVFNLSGDVIFIDWIPWTLNGFMIAYVVSYGTDIKLSKALFGALLAIVFALGSMYVWDYALDSQVDSRDLLLVSSLIYSIGLSISLATQAPQAKRYFLRVEGPIKTMEVALYKWMNAQTIHRRVTIGKSVDCNLQMSWDVNSHIAPIHAEIVSARGNIYLVACEDGVAKDTKNLAIGKRVRLYHGDRFSIGQTTFTYIEHYT